MPNYIMEWLSVQEERLLLHLLKRHETPIVKLKGRPNLILTNQRLLQIQGVKFQTYQLNSLTKVYFKDHLLLCSLKIAFSPQSGKTFQTFYFGRKKKPQVHAAFTIINQLVLSILNNAG